MGAECARRTQPPSVFSRGVGIGQPEKVLFQNWKALELACTSPPMLLDDHYALLYNGYIDVAV